MNVPLPAVVIPPDTIYEVVDSRTLAVVYRTTYQHRKLARVYADRRDNSHGAVISFCRCNFDATITATITAKRPDPNAALASFVTGCDSISTTHHLKHFPNAHALHEIRFTTMIGPRYVRVVRSEHVRATGEKISGSVHCFVDRTNGDVLKASGWSAPAKGARGNIFDSANGLGRMNEYGPAYNNNR